MHSTTYLNYDLISNSQLSGRKRKREESNPEQAKKKQATNELASRFNTQECYHIIHKFKDTWIRRDFLECYRQICQSNLPSPKYIIKFNHYCYNYKIKQSDELLLEADVEKFYFDQRALFNNIEQAMHRSQNFDDFVRNLYTIKNLSYETFLAECKAFSFKIEFNHEFLKIVSTYNGTIKRLPFCSVNYSPSASSMIFIPNDYKMIATTTTTTTTTTSTTAMTTTMVAATPITGAMATMSMFNGNTVAALHQNSVAPFYPTDPYALNPNYLERSEKFAGDYMLCIFKGKYGDSAVAIKETQLGMYDRHSKYCIKERKSLEIMAALYDKSPDAKYTIHYVGYIDLPGRQYSLVLSYIDGYALNVGLSNLPENTVPDWHLWGNPIAIHIARGLRYIHQHNIVHDDLVARNIMIQVEVDGTQKAVIIDFDCSGFVGELSVTEFFEQDNLPLKLESDIVSLGEIINSIKSGKLSTDRDEEDIEYDERDESICKHVDEQFSPRMKTLLTSCYNFFLAKRPKVQDVVTTLEEEYADNIKNNPEILKMCRVKV